MERLGADVSVLEAPALEKDLFSIFGRDVKALARSKLIELGLFTKDQELTFLNPPNVHSYKKEDGTVITSGAQYLFEGIIGQDGIKISYMPHFQKSTEHPHEPPINEEYHLLAGCAKLKLGKEFVDLNEARKFLEIKPFVRHQLITDLSPALVLIVMRNAASVPENKWHVI